MGKTETDYKKAMQHLENLQQRREELWSNGEVAKADLADYRKKSATDLIGGADGERIAIELAQHQSKTEMFVGALAEIDGQIEQAQNEADKAGQKWSAEQDEETARKVRAAAIKIIKKMGAMQIDLAKTAKQQQTTGRVIVDFEAAAGKLEESQAVLELDAEIREGSKTPSAARRAGWLDERHTVASLGSAIRDYAREKAG
jgi:hypothetical protein